MITIYLGIYTFILALLWGLFIVAKIHAYKFKSFSNSISFVTKILFIFLLTLSILGYILIYYSLNNTTTEVQNFTSTDAPEINY